MKPASGLTAARLEALKCSPNTPNFVFDVMEALVKCSVAKESPSNVEYAHMFL